MEITREYLEATMQNLDQQQQEGEALIRRCEGARRLAEALLARLDEQEGPHEIEEKEAS